MAANLEIKLINRGEEGEFLLIGNLDTQTAPQAEEHFDAAAERFDDIVINMQDLNYVSSAGLRVLKRIHVKMVKKGGKLTVRNINENIMEVFEITGFAGLLNLE